MQSQVDERKKEIHEKQLRGKFGTSERRDNAFSMLVRANEMEEKDPGGKLKLDDSELVRCTDFRSQRYPCAMLMIRWCSVDWQYLYHAFRGTWYVSALTDGPICTYPHHHIETTAHTLAATLGFLALYQDIQDEVVQQIVEVVGWDKDPVRLRLSF